jgi:hypothetical protein
MKVFVSTSKKRGWMGCERCAKSIGFKTIEQPGEIVLNQIHTPGVKKLYCDNCFIMIYERDNPVS